jgi:hypothetical protein
MKRLVRLYPRAWRDRYGDELTNLVTDLAREQDRLRLALDLGRGALDAHLNRRHELKRYLSDAALRRGAYDGLIVAAVIAVVAFLTVVVFPQGPNESDDDPEYLVQIFAAYVLLAIALMAAGARGQRRSASPYGGLKAGAAAWFVIARVHQRPAAAGRRRRGAHGDRGRRRARLPRWRPARPLQGAGGPALMRSRAPAVPPRHQPMASTHQVRPASA